MRAVQLVVLCLCLCSLAAAQWGACPSTSRKRSLDDNFEVIELPSFGRPQRILLPRDRRRQSSSDPPPVSECQTFTLPLTPSMPTSATISVFVKRFYAGSFSAAARQMWMIAGGPGQFGAPLYDAASYVANQLTDTVIYVPDVRGTGSSTRLQCSAGQDPTTGSIVDMDACLSQLQSVNGVQYVTAFNTNNTALDIIALIQQVKSSTAQQEVVLYGASYGTYLVTRIMLLRPALATSAILDGAVSPGSSLLDTYARDNVPFQYLLSLCSVDSVCNSKLQGNPTTFIENLWLAIDAGSCPQFASTRDEAMDVFGAFLNPAFVTPWILPLAYRAKRCNKTDIDVINAALKLLDGPSTPQSFNEILFFVIGESELTNLPWNFTDADWRAYYNVQNLIFHSTPGGWFTYRQKWPFNYTDPLTSTYIGSAVQTNVLILAGDMDFNTPYSWANNYSIYSSAPRVTLLKLPYAGHVTIYWASNPMAGTTVSCGMTSMIDFIKSPSSAPILSAGACIQSIAPAAVDGLTLAVTLGISDAWEGAALSVQPLAALCICIALFISLYSVLW